MTDRKHRTIRTIAGILGVVLSVLFSVSVAATRTRLATPFAHSASTWQR